MGSKSADKIFNDSANLRKFRVIGDSSDSSSNSNTNSTNSTQNRPSRCDVELPEVEKPRNAIKKEPADDEITEYAATAMSELLGWYGYEKVDSGYTRGLNLEHFSPQMDGAFLLKGISQKALTTNFNSSSNLRRNSNTPPLSLKIIPTGRNVNENVHSPDSSTGGGRSCTWCGRVENFWGSGRASNVSYDFVNDFGEFCSEACFVAGRRDAFKRAKTCDWCRHVRNSVSYVDFQDGKSQLQFCSDKCLNQYKMNIFCRETRTHLALHGLSSIPSGNIDAAGLITPEMWLRNCPSPSQNDPQGLIIVHEDENNEDADCNDENSKFPPIPFDEEEKQGNPTSRDLNFKVRRMRDRFRTRNRETNEENGGKGREITGKSSKERKFEVLEKPRTELCAGKSLNLTSSFGIHGNSNAREGSVHLRNIKELRECKFPGNGSCDSWRNRSNVQKDISFSPSEDSSASQNFVSAGERKETSSSSFSARQRDSFLPPVTILVPYPIPIPIPIPIPMPVSLLEKYRSEKKETATTVTDGVEDKSSSEKITDEAQSGNPRDSAGSKEDKLVELPVDRQIPSRPPRKRKRVNENPEDGEIALKRKSKFLSV